MSDSKGWAVILGASSGFGGATALELARSGFDIFGVHMDLRSTLPNAQAIQAGIEKEGRQAVFFNMNAADEAKRDAATEEMAKKCDEDGSFVRVLMHSLAFGALLPVIGDTPKERLSQKQLEMTLDVMANSLIYWAQGLASHNLLRRGSRIFAMTSSGSTRVIKQLRRRLRRQGRPGSPHPPACLRAGAPRRHGQLDPRRRHRHACPAPHPRRRRPPRDAPAEFNPSGRTTTPEDVAQAIAALSDERLHWLTGNVLGVDGGEEITV